MPKSSTGWPLPHLTQEDISDRDHQEFLLNRELERCSRSEFFDDERAHHLMCHYTVEIFKIHLAAYSSRPEFTAKWITEILDLSVYRALRKANPHVLGDVTKKFQGPLLAALREHLKANPPIALSQISKPKQLLAKNDVQKQRIPRSIQSSSAARKLEEYLSKSGLTQTQFSVQIDADVKTLYRFRKTGKIGKSVARRIAAALGVTLNDLLF